MGVVAIVLAACALVLVIAAEWPRIAGQRGWSVQPRARRRRRRKGGLTVIEGGDSDDFAASVERDLENLEIAARLHDMGHLAISIEVLNKPGQLTPEEMDIVRSHPWRAVELLKPFKHLTGEAIGQMKSHMLND